ncbi:MAG: hypothetical protein HWD59_04515 [Coxiellaceae bacterium]|nr:MAG: hypothetical protein HWD59_04515 [Coxiellaceae bacterium]
MKIKSLNFLIGPFMVLLSASCPAIAEPNQQLLEVAHVVHKQYPHAKIITSSFCNLGEAKLAAFGLVIETVNNQSDDPLQPIIAVKQNNQWKLNRLSKSIDYSGGMDRDFLSDFSSPTRAKARQQLVVRCVIPQSDYQINIQSNGEFTNDYF